jgi:capsular polysaccharide biosynthesis protein
MDDPLLPALRLPRVEATVEVFRDILAVPGNYCLFDASGSRIDRSVSWTDGRRRGPASDRIVVPHDPTVIADPVVFGGLLPKAHFGHVLLEMFTRLWAHDAGYAGADVPIVHFTHYQRPLEPFERRLLDAAFDPPRPSRLAIDRPLILREVIIPSQAIILGQPMRPEVLPLYDRIRANLAGPSRPDPTPVYLSRSRLSGGRRLTLGESALENRLRRRGVRVIHPQELALEDQVQIVGSATTVIGLAGSALHLTVLRDVPDAVTISLDPRTPFAVQRDIDHLRGARFRHVHAQLPLHPRLPDGRVLEIGRYRNFLLPRKTEGLIMDLLD